MTSRVSWSVDGIEPSVREKAEAAARRAGLSLGDWLNSAIGIPASSARDAHDVAEIHKRLDSITRQVEQISHTGSPQKSDSGVARQLNDAISRLDARLSQISDNAPLQADSYRPAPQPYAQQPHRPSPSMTPSQIPQMDFSIAEIVARQGELDGHPMRRMPAPTFAAPQYAPPIQPQVDLSGIERQMSLMSDRIEALRRPDVEQSIASFRSELTEIRQAITEAMPRRAIESLEGEIRSLGRRIDETRSNGIDPAALSGVERVLSEIRGELRSLTPAEQLAGFDGAIRNLGSKIDTIVRSSHDPATIQQLEDAIAALKVIVSNVASNDALNQLADHVQTLSAKVDQLSRSGGNSDMLSALEQRIATLTSALETRDRPGPADSTYFDHAVRTISDRLDNLQVGNDSGASFTHVEQRVHHLLERLEATSDRGNGGGASGGGNLARVEEALSDILRHLDQQRTSAASSASAGGMDTALVDAIKRELTDMRYGQSETDRHTQDSLEVVHSTLGHVVDRLSQIEGDLRDVRIAPVARDAASRAQVREQAPRNRDVLDAPVARAASPTLRPELPNPAATQAPIARQPVAHAAPAIAQNTPSMSDVAIFGQEIEVAPPAAARHAPVARAPIDPNLPPDHPLEPGTRPQQVRGASTPSERIAASEQALSEIPAGSREPVSTSNFIQAARRAAQAAAAAPAPATSGPKANRVTALNDATRSTAKTAAKGESPVSSKIRALLVGASVVVIVLGTVKMGLNLLGTPENAGPSPAAESSEASPVASPRSNEPHSENISPITPAMTSPTRLEQQSMTPAPVAPSMSAATPAATPARPPAAATANPDVTGSIATPSERVAPAAVTPTGRKTKLTPVSDKLPDSIGGPALRAAAGKGDPGAAFEIGIRYADGRGVPASYEDAAKWYERASQGGIVPATFRLGALYEKGLGLKKDIDTARSHYIQAAERGNAKAMHNLAVLAADGGTTGPNYKVASQWFRKAAERGIADSQYNLAILFARGIGVEQNLAESFKWFSLSAAQGDADSARKRDDVAKRLDAQSLAAAKLAIQTFVAEAQPEEAVSAGAPAGGWDVAASPKVSAKPAKSKNVAAAKLN